MFVIEDNSYLHNIVLKLVYECYNYNVLNMPINDFGNSSNNSGNKIDTSLFVQKPYLRTNYIEANAEEDIDLKNQFRNKNLPNPTEIHDA